MFLKGTIEEKLTELVGHEWQIRNGLTVPRTDDIVLRDGAVQLDAVYLYTNMMGSTRLVSEFAPETAAKVTRAFINTACRVIRNRDGHIRSFDGDRVMGIFVGADKEGRAVRTALEITYATDKIVWPALERRLPSLTRQGFKLRHVSGVAAGPVFMARTGIYDHNDLISTPPRTSQRNSATSGKTLSTAATSPDPSTTQCRSSVPLQMGRSCGRRTASL
ncbi:hypothetical protein [Streptomyces sp. NPDC057072]|uniref:hypothetical protein n=1 Tax=Streptomyces sp. NPDC057072 TaxID=3346014 RepID=UPI003642CE65